MRDGMDRYSKIQGYPEIMRFLYLWYYQYHRAF